jgi:hypothetical protein
VSLRAFLIGCCYLFQNCAASAFNKLAQRRVGSESLRYVRCTFQTASHTHTLTRWQCCRVMGDRCDAPSLQHFTVLAQQGHYHHDTRSRAV